MSIKVDPTKIDELSLKLKGLGDGTEDGERRVHQSLYRFLQDLRGRYDEEREVQRALDAVEDSLREVTDSARILTSSLHQKAKGLTQVSQTYLDSEESVKKTIQQHFAFPSSYYGKTGAFTGDGAAKYLKDPLFDDPVVQKLHQQALHGTEEEKQEAKQKLDTIFKARYDIGRAQMAYSVYKAFNNKLLMEGAHKEAERLRKVLKGLGIDEKYYGKEVKLSHLFSGAPIQACSYDPSFSITKDGKFIPMEMPKDNQYIYLLGLMMKGGKEGAWAKSQLGEIHKLLTEIGRSQTAWHEYKAKNMQKEMDGAHAYAEKLRTALKTKYSLSSEMVDDVDYRELWMGAGPAGTYLKTKEKENKTPSPNSKPSKPLDLADLKSTNTRIKGIEDKNKKIQAIYARNTWLLPYITQDQTNKAVMNSLKKFQQHYAKYKHKYEAVSKKTGIPPELIAAIHWREGSGNFDTYLHNGDPLGKKTVHVPKGIFFTDWEEAAIHAINMKKSVRDKVGINHSTKDIAKMMTYAECYNGLGYINHKVNSVYVFSGTNIPLEGKYYKDNVFTYGPVKDDNPGVAVMLLSLTEAPNQVSPNKENTQPKPQQSVPSKSAQGVDEVREKVLDLAKKFQGKVPYYMDSNRPKYMDPDSPPKAMDCSDFTSAIYRTILRDLDVGSNIDIGANTRTQIGSGLEVWTKDKKGAGNFNISKLKKGDLILFTSPNSSTVGHVGFYLGDGKFIHESGSNKKGGNVKVSELKGYWLTTQKPISVRRIIGDDGNVYGQKGKKVGMIK
ncbi:C40 family peptidase [Paenibacillus sp. alder61]|uniref:NlpC/P60 domain-containing protein n=1 Tax=Paenibacillus faecis TaxID=862114 RepID=A0A5D0CZ68_9BACL|nr:MULTISPECIES: NlpC/P60 family protein [Paenibacillus]MCA1293762.1 C40 family peptidase [Paenibacillus sp. alder61]TYA15349.1 hypothetical protein FRY98_06905 [Paenibacillus faecis]